MDMSRFKTNTTVLVAFVALTFGFTSPAQAWSVTSEIDDFGSKLVLAGTFFAPGLGNTDSFDEAYDSGNSQALMIRCQDATLEIYLKNFSGKFDKSSTALVKFGNSTSKKWAIGLSTNKDSIFFDKPRTLATTFTKNKKFYVRGSSTTGYVTANFDISGLSESRTEFKNAGCKF